MPDDNIMIFFHEKIRDNNDRNTVPLGTKTDEAEPLLPAIGGVVKRLFSFFKTFFKQ